jgi:hypothetical protein
MVVVANQATERIQLVKLDGTFVRRSWKSRSEG